MLIFIEPLPERLCSRFFDGVTAEDDDDDDDETDALDCCDRNNAGFRDGGCGSAEGSKKVFAATIGSFNGDIGRFDDVFDETDGDAIVRVLSEGGDIGLVGTLTADCLAAAAAAAAACICK